MGIPVYDGDQVGNDGYAILSGSSVPRVIIYPRTLGGYILESGVVTKKLALKTYLVPPTGTTRLERENFYNLLNEQVAGKSATLELNGNEYLNCDVGSIDYELSPVSMEAMRYTINFVLGDQNESGTIRQLAVPDLSDFSRGRKATFVTELEDGDERTFNLWHNVDKIRNLEVKITIHATKSFGGGSRTVRRGGFERIMVDAWIKFDDEAGVETRKSVEAYFYNVINGPLGRVGTLILAAPTSIIGNSQSKNIFNHVFFESMTMGSETHATLKYQITFLSSLQC